MTSEGPSVERLREYLRSLKPAARAMLIAELERGVLRGDDAAGNDFVLDELRRSLGSTLQPEPHDGEAVRLFFRPLEPFVVDCSADHKRIGRLGRAALQPMWQWLSRELMPREATAFAADIERALQAGDRGNADQIVRALQDRAVQHMRAALASIGTDDKAQRRFIVQVGTPHAAADVATVIANLENRDIIADLALRLPPTIRAFEREQIVSVKAQLDSAVNSKSLDGAPTRKADILRSGLLLVMTRLTAPWQLIRIASRAADSDDAARIAETPYALAVSIVLGEMEQMVGELRAEFKARRPITSLVKGLHDAVRGLRTELDLSVESPWSRQVVAIRSAVSDLLKPEIDGTPGRVRRLLRLRAGKEIAPGALLDAIDVDEAEAGVEFLRACRHYAAELALSEVTLRAFSDLTQYLETQSKVLLDSLRHAEDFERPFRQSQLGAAIRFCRTVFGGEYAGLLSKAADVAAQAAAPDRKSARA